jgi:hypothetical protein
MPGSPSSRMRIPLKSLGLLCLVAGCLGTPTAPRPVLEGEGRRVMFIGNSYLYTQDVPGLVQALADSAGGDKLAVMSVTGPDMALIDHWKQGWVQSEMARHNFEWVVLQQGPSSVQVNRDSLRLVTKMFADQMAAVGSATPALFSAWPSQSRPQDFPRAIESYRLAASDVEGVFLPIAGAWLAAWERQPDLQLYADGLHASPAGAYLAALVIYAKLLNATPIGLPSAVRTHGGYQVVIDPALATMLQEVAASVTQTP